MATIAISALGATIGGSIGGTFLGVAASTWGWMAGSVIGGLLDQPKGLHIEGPRLNDSTYAGTPEGADIPELWGGGRIRGVPIWLDEVKEVKIETSSGGGKGGGAPKQTYTRYEYYQTFAVSFGMFEAQPRRMWLNGKLVLDQSGESQTAVDGDGVNFTVHTPSTNEIDSLIEADVGEGNCPSYKNQTVIVFESLLLNDYANRLPNIEAEFWSTEVSNTSSDIDLGIYYGGSVENIYAVSVLRHPSENVFLTTVTHNFTPAVATEPVYMTDMGSRNVSIINETATDTILNSTWDSRFDILTGISYELYPDAFYISERDTGFTATVHRIEYPSGKHTGTTSWSQADGGVFLGEQSASHVPCGVRNLSVSFWVLSKGNTGLVLPEVNTAYNINTNAGTSNLYSSVLARTATCVNWFEAEWCFVGKDSNQIDYELFKFDANGNIFRLSHPFADENYFPDYLNFGVTSADFAFGVRRGVYIKETNEVWFGYKCTAPVASGYTVGVLMMNPDDGSIINHFNAYREGYDSGNNLTWSTFDGDGVFDYSINSNEVYFMLALDSVFGINIYSHAVKKYPANGLHGRPAVYYPGRNSFWCSLTEYKAPDYEYLMREVTAYVTTSQIAVSDIVSDLCQKVGLTTNEIDTTGLTSSYIYGYVKNRTYSARAAIEALLLFANADGYQSDNKIKFKLRGGNTDVTINPEHLDVTEPSGPTSNYPLVKIVKPDHLSVPKIYEMNYISLENILTRSIAQSYYATGDALSKSSFELALLLSDQQAVDTVARLHNQMVDTTVYEFYLPIIYSYLEPTDIIELPVNGVNERVRIVSIDRGVNWILKCKGITDAAEFSTTNATAFGNEAFLSNIAYSLPIRTELIDVTLLQDIDLDHPGPYLTSYIYGDNFPQVTHFYSFDDVNYFPIDSQADQPFVGLVQEASNSTTWENWDDVETIVVQAYNNKTIASSTKAAIEADPTINAFAYGRQGRWELLNAATVTLISSGTQTIYQLSNLLRGRRGTNVYIDSHEEKDYLIKLDPAYITRHSLQINQLNTTVYYKTLKSYETIADVQRNEVYLSGQQLLPYSPIQIDVVLDGDDIDISWTRRTRKGGSLGGDNNLTDNVGGPINEDVEAYEIDIVNTSTQAVLGTYSVSASTAYTYTLAQQQSDGTDTLGTFAVDIYQLSAIMGRGRKGTGEFDRG